MKRTAAVLSVATLLLSACTTPAPVATTAPSPTLPSEAPDTSAQVPATAPATTTAPLTVEGVPAEALALIGAPMPEVDLTMESPEDFERWFREYEKWDAWLGANPTEDSDVLEYALVPDSPYYVSTRESQARVLEAGLVLVPEMVPFVEIQRLQTAGDFFGEGIMEATIWVMNSGSSWFIELETGLIVQELQASPSGEFVAIVLRLKQDSDGIWKLMDSESP